MKLVLDTNVYVAASFGGHAARLVEEWAKGRITLVLSESMRLEHETILNKHPRANLELFRSWCALWDNPERTLLLREEPAIEAGWCKDASDDKFIAAALKGEAPYLITADKMLLTLVRIQTVQMLQVKKFLEEVWTPSSVGLDQA
jgi:putative PIN family toxin of toxin-antitoxin system